MTITLTKGFPCFKVFEKPLSLHLYIPPSSAHPPSCMKGLIYGMLIRYWRLNTTTEDYMLYVKKFFARLIYRGHDVEKIHTLFIAAGEHIQAKYVNHKQSLTPVLSIEDSLKFVWQYHPRGVQAANIQKLFEKRLKGKIPFETLTVAYKRPKNLRDLLMSNRCTGVKGSTAAQLFHQWKDGNAPPLGK